jgi:Ser/Thr protein kinase RdoA (MazF antagonist)
MTGTVRQGPSWLKRELEVASFLVACGCPVVPPSQLIDPGPHQHNGLALTFWEWVEPIDGPLDPRAAGKALRACHEALTGYPGDLPRLAVLEEAGRLVTLIRVEKLLSPADVALLERVQQRLTATLDGLALPLQALHGDATLGNVLDSRCGPLWGDFEDTFLGPTGWDLGCLASGARVYGTAPEEVAEALAGYGATMTEELLDLFIEARTFQVAAWLAFLVPQQAGWRVRLEARLRWLRELEATG